MFSKPVMLAAVVGIGACSLHADRAYATPIDELKQTGERLMQSWQDRKSSNPGIRQSNRCTFPATLGGKNFNVVSSVAPNETVFRTGDKIVALNGTADTPVFETLSAIDPGATVVVTLLRDGQNVVQNVQCLDSSTSSSLIERLYNSMIDGDAPECVRASEDLRQFRGRNAFSTWIHNKCEKVLNSGDEDWLSDEYPKIQYELAFTEMREEAYYALHEGRPFSDYEPRVNQFVNGFNQEGHPQLAAEILRQYEELTASLFGDQN